jgi:hypothetical protein
VLGFATFLTHLGTGYLDTWHGMATVAILPLFVLGLARTRSGLAASAPSPTSAESRQRRIGRELLMLTGFGMLVAGTTIVTIGSLVVFVPQDLEFLGLDRHALEALDRNLVPLIAHDRSGFGGGVAITGLVVMACVRWGRPSRSLWEALLLAGLAGFGAAIGIHLVIGYLDVVHLGPAILGAAVFAAGMALTWPESAQRQPGQG